MVNLGRFLEVDSETELLRATKKFTERFIKMENMAKDKNTNLDQLSLMEMNKLWEKAKEK